MFETVVKFTNELSRHNSTTTMDDKIKPCGGLLMVPVAKFII